VCEFYEPQEGQLKGGVVKMPTELRPSIESIQQDGIYLLDHGTSPHPHTSLFLSLDPSLYQSSQ
jgi:hypothetical protein